MKSNKFFRDSKICKSILGVEVEKILLTESNKGNSRGRSRNFFFFLLIAALLFCKMWEIFNRIRVNGYYAYGQ